MGLKPRQEWKVGNYALMQSWATGTPVRVVRCEKQKGSSPRYHFDGCYRITAAYTNCYQFKDRPPIYPLRDNAYRRCMFRLEAIPGLAVAKPVAQVRRGGSWAGGVGATRFRLVGDALASPSKPRRRRLCLLRDDFDWAFICTVAVTVVS